MLRDSFYFVLDTIVQNDSSCRLVVKLNKEHEIFKGHFPAVPVVPGVCMMQMVKELLEERIQRTLRLSSAGNIKFLALINPMETPKLEVMVKFSAGENGSYHMDGAISAGELTYFKLVKAVYK